MIPTIAGLCDERVSIAGGISNDRAHKRSTSVSSDPSQKELNGILSDALLPTTAAIARIAHNANLILPLVRVGALSPLINLCTHQHYSHPTHGEADIMANVTLSLAMLAAHNAGNAHLMLAGVVPALLDLCGDRTTSEIASDLWDQSKSTDDTISSTASPKKYGSLLQNRDSRVLCNAVSALADLACHKPNVKGLVKEGAIKVLVQLLFESTSSTVWQIISEAQVENEKILTQITEEGTIAVLSNVSLALSGVWTLMSNKIHFLYFSGLTDEEGTIFSTVHEGVLAPLLLLCRHAVVQEEQSAPNRHTWEREEMSGEPKMSPVCLPATLILPLEITCNVTLTIARLSLTSDMTIVTKIAESGIIDQLLQLCLPQGSYVSECVVVNLFL